MTRVKQSMKEIEEVGHGFAHRVHRSKKNQKPFKGRIAAKDRKQYLESLREKDIENEIRKRGIKIKL